MSIDRVFTYCVRGKKIAAILLHVAVVKRQGDVRVAGVESLLRIVLSLWTGALDVLCSR